WKMDYSERDEGGPIADEADQTGVGAWTRWQHYVMYPSKKYLDAVYPAIAAAANWMTLYAEPSGRQGPGQEDDSFVPSDGLQGAVTQWLGLESAVRAALAERDTANASTWSARADALKASLLSRYWPGGKF